ncbi:MAG: hypothetical protein COW65_17630 [Cytophagales bacterium CG18_big_fil_WC_8_21_14_2_50_42_9]|nr:MAG: hypothetical protein COW65_17630 [Cytophagales bacterium CG18_big_fil_WC_8_21_14_2_50_42_9]
MKHSLPIFYLALCLFFSSCASIFHSIDPQKIPFSYTENNADVQFSYAYDVLALKGNKKYLKKEIKNGMRVVAVRITNNSPQALQLNENLKLIVGINQATPIDPIIVSKDIKQGTWIYLLYTPLTLTFSSTTTNSYGYIEPKNTSVFPIGPFIAAGNLLLAHSSNQNFRKELNKFNLLGKRIEPGQTVYGLITLHSLTAEPIKFEIQ